MISFTGHRSNWIRDIGSLSALRMSEYLLPLITLPIVVRVLGPETYGKWVYVQVLVSFFSLAANPGLISYGQQQISAHREKARELVPSISSFRFGLGLLTYATLVGVLVFLKPDATTQWLILLFGLTLIIGPLSSVDWLFAGLQRFDRVALLQVIFQVIFTGGIIFFLRRGDLVWILPVLVLTGNIIVGFLSWHWLEKEGIKFRMCFMPREWWHISQVSFYYGFASTMVLIYNKADHMILSWLKGDYTLGQYAACYRLMGALMGFVLVGTSVFVPRAAEVSSKTPERFCFLLRKGLLMITAISLPVAAGAFCLSNSMITLILGPKYLESEGIFCALALVIPFGVSASFFCGSLLFATGHHRQYATAATIGAIINMVFNLLLIPSMGALGAALATLFAQGAVTGAAIYMGRQYLNKVLNRSLLHPVAAAFCMLLLLTIISAFGWNIVVMIAIGALSYVLILWIFDRMDGRELSNLLLSSIRIRNLPTSQP